MYVYSEDILAYIQPYSKSQLQGARFALSSGGLLCVSSVPYGAGVRTEGGAHIEASQSGPVRAPDTICFCSTLPLQQPENN